jgi:hypothetical protein
MNNQEKNNNYNDINLVNTNSSIGTNGKNNVSNKLILQEKTKIKEKKEYNFEVQKKPTLDNNNLRKDYFGTAINHQNKKKVKVTFKDKVNNNSKDLIEITEFESVKKYNYVPNAGKRKDSYVKEKEVCCSGCVIF